MDTTTISTNEEISEGLVELMNLTHAVKKALTKFQQDHASSLRQKRIFWYNKGIYNHIDGLYNNFQELHYDLWAESKSKEITNAADT